MELTVDIRYVREVGSERCVWEPNPTEDSLRRKTRCAQIIVVLIGWLLDFVP